MDPRHLEELIQLERGYWWHVSKRAAVRQVIAEHAPPPGLVVEGGVGGGLMLRELADAGYRVAGFDVMPAAVAHCHEMGLPDVAVHDLEKPWPVEERSARAVLLLDVLEHLDHPSDVLRGMGRALAPGGVAILTVPAYPALLGPWDRMLGHKRRYTRDMMRQQAREAGMRVRWMTHWNAFSVPPALVLRTVEKLRGGSRGAEFPRVPAVVNTALRAAARAERLAMRVRPVPVGLSLLAVLEVA